MDLTVLLLGNDQGQETRVPLMAGIEKRDILMMFLRNLISREPLRKTYAGKRSSCSFILSTPYWLTFTGTFSCAGPWGP
jgi:hypothetical protein